MKDKTIDRIITSLVLAIIVIPAVSVFVWLSYKANEAGNKWDKLHKEVYEAAWYVCHEKMYPSWKYLGSQCFKDYHRGDNFVNCRCLYMGEDRDELWRDVIIYKDNDNWR